MTSVSSANRRLLLITISGAVLFLVLLGMGNWLLRYTWFMTIFSSAWLVWLTPILGLTVYIGAPVLLILLIWRWEPRVTSWPQVLVRWLIGMVLALIGWWLTNVSLSVANGINPFAFFRETLIPNLVYMVSFLGGTVALIGFVDWFFFTRHWRRQQLTKPSP